MYVCICYGVTSEQINKAILDGAKTTDDITRITGAGSNCGTCVNEFASMLIKHYEKNIANENLPEIMASFTDKLNEKRKQGVISESLNLPILKV